MLRKIFLLAFLIVLMTGLSHSVQPIIDETNKKTFSFTPVRDFNFADRIIVLKAGDRLIVRDPIENQILNVDFEGSQFLSNFDVIVINNIHNTKFAYEFTLPNNNYKFNITLHGTINNENSLISQRSNSTRFQLGKLIVDFSDFEQLGLEGYPITIGNTIYYNFEPDWNAIGYSSGDLVYLDPLFNYDFGASGGVFAARCEGTSSIENDDTIWFDTPCPASFLDITGNSNLDTSDDLDVRVLNSGSTDKGFVLFFFDVTNATTAGLGNLNSLKFSWEGNQTITTDPIDMRVYNYGNTSWETCNTFEPASVGVDEIQTCKRTAPVETYFNATNHMSFVLFTENDDAGVADTHTDYVSLQIDLGAGNSTFFHSNGQDAERDEKFLNITFIYETNNSKTSATLDSEFIYKPTPSDNDLNTTTHINSTGSLFYEFSYFPETLNISAESTLIYNNHGSQTRTFKDTLFLANSNHTNDDSNLTLYLLPSSDGIFVTFQIIDVGENAISGVVVSANRSVTGKNVQVQKATTGSAGTTSFFLDPDISHDFIFSKTGFNTLESSFAPTQSLYTITLGGGSAVVANQTNFFKGISYEFTPSDKSLINNTIYDFSFNIDSSFHPLDVVGFRLFNGTGAFLTNESCTGAVGGGCNATLNVDVGTNATIIMNAFWNIKGNVTNVTTFWRVFSVDNRTGIASFDNLKHDFKQLANSFGSGSNAEFTKGIISFLIILFGTGALAFRTGIFSPLAILTYMFGITAFLDVIDLLPSTTNITILGGDPNYVTILVGVMVLIAYIMELKQ